MSKLKKVEREKTEIKAKGTKKREVRDPEQKVNDYKGEGGNVSAPRTAVQEAARAFHAACKGASVASAGRPAAGNQRRPISSSAVSCVQRQCPKGWA